MFGLGMWGAWALECPSGVGYVLYWMSGDGTRGDRLLEALRGSAQSSSPSHQLWPPKRTQQVTTISEGSQPLGQG